MTDPTSDPVPAPDEHTIMLPRERPSFAWLVDLNPLRRGRLYALDADGSSLGRSTENDIIIEEASVSRFHARLYAETGGVRPQYYIQDLASANGTFVNETRVAQRALADDDRLAVGDVTLVFKQL